MKTNLKKGFSFKLNIICYRESEMPSRFILKSGQWLGVSGPLIIALSQPGAGYKTGPPESETSQCVAQFAISQ